MKHDHSKLMEGYGWFVARNGTITYEMAHDLFGGKVSKSTTQTVIRFMEGPEQRLLTRHHLGGTLYFLATQKLRSWYTNSRRYPPKPGPVTIVARQLTGYYVARNPDCDRLFLRELHDEFPWVSRNAPPVFAREGQDLVELIADSAKGLDTIATRVRLAAERHTHHPRGRAFLRDGHGVACVLTYCTRKASAIEERLANEQKQIHPDLRVRIWTLEQPDLEPLVMRHC